MIANCHRVESECTHREHHRIWRLIVFATVIRREWAALDSVAGINQEDVWLLIANASDECRNFCEAAVVRFVGVVIDGVDVAVKIGGAENRYLNSFRRKASSDENERKQDDESC